MNGLVGDFTFAARIKDKKEPISTLFFAAGPNRLFGALMAKAEETFVTGKCRSHRTDSADHRTAEAGMNRSRRQG